MAKSPSGGDNSGSVWRETGLSFSTYNKENQALMSKLLTLLRFQGESLHCLNWELLTTNKLEIANCKVELIVAL